MPKKRVTLDAIDRKLSKVLKNQKKFVAIEKLVHEEENEELRQLKEIEALEESITKEVGPHPLRKLTYHDLFKGCVGAFVGVAAHYTFVYGVKVAHQIDVVRATLLFPISYALGAVFIYLTGFRRVKDKKILSFLPVRLTVLYFTAIITAIFVLWLFTPGFFMNPVNAYKEVAVVTLSAIIGACTADLIGRE